MSKTPRFGLFLCDCVDSEKLVETIGRIPRECDEWIDEIVVMLDRPDRRAEIEVRGTLEIPFDKVSFFSPPQESDFGTTRKGAFEYALLKGMGTMSS